MFYYNFFTVGGLIATLFTLLGSGFLLLLKNRSESTSALGNVFLWFLPVNGAYFFATMLDHPDAAYHRYLTVSGVLLSFLYMTNFALKFPNNDNPKLTKWVFRVQLLLGIGTIAYFIGSTYNVSKVFVWTGHIYDFNAREASQWVARMALFYLIVFVAITAYRVGLIKTRERWSLLYIALLLAASMVIPTVTNIMSLMGKMTRGTHNMWFVFTTIVGYFAVLIIYINVTRDRTTLMSKIVGTTAVTILLVIQTLSYFALSGAEEKYDRLKFFEAKQALSDETKGSFAYAVASPPGGQAAKKNELTVYVGGELSLDRNQLKKELAATKAQGLKRAYRNFGSAKYLAVQFDWRNRRYEVGYPYADYRRYVDSTAYPISMTAVILFLGLLSVFPYFFRVNLVNPLQLLLRGVSKVNHGDLNVSVPVRVTDEIGYISETFNGMVSSIREANAQLKEYAEQLEEKVKERTQELEQSLDEVRALKQQQDGDYWLASLLLVPLGANKIDSRKFNVDFMLSQKKKFTFKKRDCEIGGDICIAQTVQLSGKQYHIIANCDAMGKALQGASGALVLGSVLEARIERTLVSRTAQDQSPERWLKNAFIELQKVFERFDGSMLMSTIICLVEEENGTIYYINAEHPNMVVYRNNEAFFVEPDRILRKLGTPMFMDSWIRIEVFQMLPGDVLIMGSDGRDDIITAQSNGQSVMNTDHLKFLDLVKDAGGDLTRIAGAIEQSGEITDDLSLIRIGYSGMADVKLSEPGRELMAEYRQIDKELDSEERVELLKNVLKEGHNREALKEISKILLRAKEYSRAIAYLEVLTEKFPGETEFMYYASYCMLRTGQLKEAIVYGERARLRNPRNIRYLISLAHCYRRAGSKERAEKLTAVALEVQPENQSAIRLNRALHDYKRIADSEMQPV